MATGIHIFRKDLRTKDNLALNALAARVDRILGVFVFDPKQINSTRANKSHHSQHAASFVIESVQDLSAQCDGKLLLLYGDPLTELERLFKRVKPAAISWNADFTPYALRRDASIQKLAQNLEIDVFISEDDQTLAPMASLLKSDGTPYMTFGAFFKHIQRQPIKSPIKRSIKWATDAARRSDGVTSAASIWPGGRAEALRRLRSFTIGSDKPASLTSRLSAYMNHGCISIREVYWALKKLKMSVRPIVWRDFFLCIYRFHPRGNSYTQFLDERYNAVKWPKLRQSDWTRFVDCKTGFLLVDAAMAELQQTGFINSRSRLILATFWIKYLLVSPFDRQYGSQTGFSRLLIDCCASQNKLNHQWVLGDLDLSGRRFATKGAHPLTGRSMRVDNGMIKRYDPDFRYIKKWVPGFENLSLKECKAKKVTPMYEWKRRYLEFVRLFEKLPRD